jgi:type I restriction enzyme S subunit
MKSNYRRIGDFIELVDERNKELEVNTLVGLSISKEFIPSVANTIGTNMANYKIIQKNQFACSLMQVRRDKKIPVALLQKFDEAIISQAYPVFQIKDEMELLPQYLMMWMSRSEFDRHACFLAVGGVRGSLEWDDFCDMELPIPCIEKQREIVKEYNTIVNRIKLNEKLNQKLEETAQALYKHWFVDFEFPNGDGKPYKSSGGKMVYSAELDKEIPEGWKLGGFNDIVIIEDGDRGRNYPKQEDFLPTGDCLFLGAPNMSRKGFLFGSNVFISKEKDYAMGNGKLKRNDIVLTTRGSSIGKVGLYTENIVFEKMRINSGMVILRAKKTSAAIYIFTLLKSQYFQSLLSGYLSGSAQPQIPIRDMITIPVLIPDKYTLQKFNNHFISFQDTVDLTNQEIVLLDKTRALLLSKLATIEN